MTDTTVLTERESYIVAQALYEFIRLEHSKPRETCVAGQTSTTQRQSCTRGSTTSWRF
jgi:hypothetical protein